MLRTAERPPVAQGLVRLAALSIRTQAASGPTPGEKLVKKWRREWKFALIEADNPEWRDLWEEWFPAGGC